MSRSDLLDLALEHGGARLIPTDLCQARKIGTWKVWAVLTHRLMYADTVGVVAWGTPRIADVLGMDRRDVRDADAVLIDAGLMAPIGKPSRGRATSYRMLPALLDAITEAHEQGDAADEKLAGKLAGQMAGQMAGIPATKRSEELNPPPTPHEKRTPVRAGQERRVRNPDPKPKPRREPPAAPIGAAGPEPDPQLVRRCELLAADWRRTRLTARQLLDLACQASPDDPGRAISRMRQIGEQTDLAGPDIRSPIAVLRHRLGDGAAAA